jgi:hypothetical protein
MVPANRPPRLGGGLTLRLDLRSVYLIIAMLLLLIMPIGHPSVLLVLFVAADLGAAALSLRPKAAEPTPVVSIAGDTIRLALLRRTVPELRMRRPLATVEAQIQWRQASQNYRRRQELS